MTKNRLQDLKNRKSIRFLLVGGWNTGFGYVAFAGVLVATNHFHIHYLFALIVSQVICVGQAYILYKYLVFKTPRLSWMEMLRFASVYIGQCFLNLFLLPFFVSTFRIQPLLAQAIVIPIIVITSYFAHNHVSFTDQKIDK